jgi:hypothetical protein
MAAREGLSWQPPARDESEAPYENDHISHAVLCDESTIELHGEHGANRAD